jgi:hypothetical protein
MLDTLMATNIETMPDLEIMPPDWPKEKFPLHHCPGLCHSS